jgi:hypothetical protein
MYAIAILFLGVLFKSFIGPEAFDNSLDRHSSFPPDEPDLLACLWASEGIETLLRGCGFSDCGRSPYRSPCDVDAFADLFANPELVQNIKS